MQILQTVLERVIEFFVSYGFEVLGALLVLFLGFKLSQWTANLTLRFLEKKQFDLTVARFMSGAVKGLILGFAIIIVLGWPVWVR